MGLPLFVGDFGPWLGIWIPRGKRRVFVDDAEVDHALVPVLAEDIPTALIFRKILFDVLFRRMQRPMRRGESHVEEEWFWVQRKIADVIRSAVSNGVGEEIIGREIGDGFA